MHDVFVRIVDEGCIGIVDIDGVGGARIRESKGEIEESYEKSKEELHSW